MAAVLIENRQKKIKIDLQRVRRALNKILRNLDCKDKEISLLFVDDEGIRAINRRFLNRDYSTNVISFSMSEGEFGNINPHILGDIVISVETAFTDALEASIEFDDEIDFLMIHGFLHLIGYNHENTGEDETIRMENKEKELFSMLRNRNSSP
ncbi:MAG: rRNA maturation RNase YbeY [Syntrophales bacterium]